MMDIETEKVLDSYNQYKSLFRFVLKATTPPPKQSIRIILQNYHDKKLFPSKKNNSFCLQSLENPIYNK